MFAVVKCGSSQYKVAEGDTIEVDKLESEAGKSLTLDNVLLYAKGADVRVGQPILKDVSVKVKVIEQSAGKKVVAFKYRRRKNSATKIGHRRKITSLSITKITAG